MARGCISAVHFLQYSTPGAFETTGWETLTGKDANGFQRSFATSKVRKHKISNGELMKRTLSEIVSTHVPRGCETYRLDDLLRWLCGACDAHTNARSFLRSIASRNGSHEIRGPRLKSRRARCQWLRRVQIAVRFRGRSWQQDAVQAVDNLRFEKHHPLTGNNVVELILTTQ
jgi:hypothetical protein